MFTEILAAHVLDPMTGPSECRHEDHRRTNCPRDMPSSPAPASYPEVQPTQHLMRKKLGGKRITLNKVVNGKPHYIGPPAVIQRA